MIYEFLETHQIPYLRVDHPAVYTCEEARQHVPRLPGAETKNLFLCDDKGKKHFLVAVGYEKSVDLKLLAGTLACTGLRLASPARLMKYLKLEPGSVTLLGVLHDAHFDVQVIIDADLWKNDALLCHPLVNTSTLVLARADLLKFFRLTGHSPQIITIPTRVQFHD